MKIAQLHRIEKYPDRRLYSFSLSVGGFIINGFVFSADTGAILSPTTLDARGRRVRIVKGFGIHWKRLRALVEAEVAQLEMQAASLNDQSSSSEEQLAS
jgi:hypothetical protein